MSIGRIARYWLLAFTSLLMGSEASADVFSLVEGSVILEKECGKTKFSDLKLLVRQDSPIDYSHNQKVGIGKDGHFSVYLVPSYNYYFQLLKENDSEILLTGTGRFEPMNPGKIPLITAKCSIAPKAAK